jgi:hypothetical protein
MQVLLKKLKRMGSKKEVQSLAIGSAFELVKKTNEFIKIDFKNGA